MVDAAKDMASSPTYAGTEEGGQAARAQEKFVLLLRAEGTDFFTPVRESFGMHVWCGDS